MILLGENNVSMEKGLDGVSDVAAILGLSKLIK
jgi:hypothetical protein